MKEEKPKQATLKELAKFLNVSVSAVSQYKKNKKMIMRLGLPVYFDNLMKK